MGMAVKYQSLIHEIINILLVYSGDACCEGAQNIPSSHLLSTRFIPKDICRELHPVSLGRWNLGELGGHSLVIVLRVWYKDDSGMAVTVGDLVY
jgi:hypothetical protein